MSCFLRRCTGQCAVDQIRSIERSYELQRMLESELCGDVAPHAMGGSRGVGMFLGQRRRASELTVLRPEVVSPLADAVSLVHRDEADVDR